MDEVQIRKELDACLSTDKEITTDFWREGFQDRWPVQRMFPLD